MITTVKLFEDNQIVSAGAGDIVLDIPSNVNLITIQTSGPYRDFVTVDLDGASGVMPTSMSDGDTRYLSHWYIKNTSTGTQTLQLRNSHGDTDYAVLVCGHTGVDVSGDPVRDTSLASSDFGSSTGITVNTLSGDLALGMTITGQSDTSVGSSGIDLNTGSMNSNGYTSFALKTGEDTSTYLGWYHSSSRRAGIAVSYKMAVLTEEPNLVQCVSSGAIDASQEVAFPLDITVGNRLVVTIRESVVDVGTPPTVTDSLSNTWTLLQSFGSGSGAIRIFSTIVTSGGTCAVDIASSASGSRISMFEFENAGTDVAAFDIATEDASPTTGVVTTTGPSLLFGMLGTVSDVVFEGPLTPWSIGPVAVDRNAPIYRYEPDAGSYSATFDWSGTDSGYGSILMAFQLAIAPVVPVSRASVIRLQMLTGAD